MEILERLNQYITQLIAQPELGYSDKTIAFDNFYDEFLLQISHQEGNAVTAVLSSYFFNEDSLAELCINDLIIYFYTNEDGNFVIESDTERLSKFSLTNLQQLYVLAAIKNQPQPWWK